jgi:hypothetical protein
MPPVNPPALPPEPGRAGGVSLRPPDALGGTVITCNALDDLRAKLTGRSGSLQALGHGTTLVMEAGHVFANSGKEFALPQLAGPGWVAVRSSKESSLPPAGTRFDPVAHAAFCARIMTTHEGAALASRDGVAGVGAGVGANGIRLVGLEIYNDPANRNDSVGNYVTAALGWPAAASVGGLTRDYAHPGTWCSRHIVERCWIHGSGWTRRGTGAGRNHQRKGLWLSCADFSVYDSVIEGYQSDGDDACALYTMVSPGPMYAENCYLSATGQGFMAGGSSADYNAGAIVQPTGLILRRCFSEKLDQWNNGRRAYDPSARWWQVVKPTYELKFAKQVLFESCVGHNSYAWPAFTFDAVDPQDFNATRQRRQTIEDVTVRYCIATWAVCFTQLWSGSNPIKRIHYEHCLAPAIRNDYRIAGVPSNAPGRAFYSANDFGIEDIWFEHVTALGDRAALDFEGKQIARARFRNNILGYGDEGISCRSVAPGSHATDALLDAQILDKEIAANALINGPIHSGGQGNPAARVPFVRYAGYAPPNNAAGEFILPGYPEKAIIDWNTGLISGGVLRKGATDGKDLGPDMALLADAFLAQVGGPYGGRPPRSVQGPPGVMSPMPPGPLTDA